MALFKRGKKDKSKKKTESPEAESSPQKVGIVSGVLSTTAETDSQDESLFSGVVARHFGPDGKADAEESGVAGSKLPPRFEGTDSQGRVSDESPEDSPAAEGGLDVADARSPSQPEDQTARRDHLRAVETLLTDSAPVPELEVDPMAHIGRTTTITGNVVAEEDLEIEGTIEGSVRLANHQVTVGVDGHVKATVEAKTIHVLGRITGDVVASELVEVESGGIVGGDVKAPRVIMHDGAIVVGGLDMSASLPNGGTMGDQTSPKPSKPQDRSKPILEWVAPPVAEKTSVENEDHNA